MLAMFCDIVNHIYISMRIPGPYLRGDGLEIPPPPREYSEKNLFPSYNSQALKCNKCQENRLSLKKILRVKDPLA